MSYMPFNSDEQPLYADEHENILFRVRDVKTLIENHTNLSVTKLLSMGSDSDPEKLEALYGPLKPERIWFVMATLQAPEGEKTAEVFVMLKDGQLSLPHGIFLHLETFLYSHQKQAKQNIPELTLDYVQTLEEIVSDTWRMWRDLSYYLHNHKDDPSAQRIMSIFKQQMDRLYKSMQGVNFLSMGDERQDPFSTGF